MRVYDGFFVNVSVIFLDLRVYSLIIYFKNLFFGSLNSNKLLHSFVSKYCYTAPPEQLCRWNRWSALGARGKLRFSKVEIKSQNLFLAIICPKQIDKLTCMLRWNAMPIWPSLETTCWAFILIYVKRWSNTTSIIKRSKSFIFCLILTLVLSYPTSCF